MKCDFLRHLRIIHGDRWLCCIIPTSHQRCIEYLHGMHRLHVMSLRCTCNTWNLYRLQRTLLFDKMLIIDELAWLMSLCGLYVFCNTEHATWLILTWPWRLLWALFCVACYDTWVWAVLLIAVCLSIDVDIAVTKIIRCTYVYDITMRELETVNTESTLNHRIE